MTPIRLSRICQLRQYIKSSTSTITCAKKFPSLAEYRITSNITEDHDNEDKKCLTHLHALRNKILELHIPLGLHKRQGNIYARTCECILFWSTNATGNDLLKTIHRYQFIPITYIEWFYHLILGRTCMIYQIICIQHKFTVRTLVWTVNMTQFYTHLYFIMREYKTNFICSTSKRLCHVRTAEKVGKSVGKSKQSPHNSLFNLKPKAWAFHIWYLISLIELTVEGKKLVNVC